MFQAWALYQSEMPRGRAVIIACQFTLLTFTSFFSSVGLLKLYWNSYS